jgi:outer membrane protein insertion porin family
MKFLGRVRLVVGSAWLCASWIPLAAQTPAQQTPPQQPPQQQSPPQQPPAQQPPAQQPPAQQRNPFETVPQTQQQPSQQQTPPPGQTPPPPQTPPGQTPPRRNPFETVPQPQTQPQPAQPQQQPAQPQTTPQLETPRAAPQVPSQLTGQVVEGIEFRGQRRVPQDTLKAVIFTKTGDLYSDETLRRDFMALWNTGRFDDIRLEVEPGQKGVLIRFVMTERRVIRSINYDGIHSVTVSEILDRFKERKVGLSVESQYDPNKIQRAAVALKEFLAERGRQYATVDPQIEQIPPTSLKVTFNVNEGPKVKVGHIDIVGNTAYNDRWVIRQMKNLKPIGVPQ